MELEQGTESALMLHAVSSLDQRSKSPKAFHRAKMNPTLQC